MIDTHAHLDAYEDAAEVVGRARAAGVARIVAVGSGIESCRATLALCRARGGSLRGAGHSPAPGGRGGEGGPGGASRAARGSEGRRRRGDGARLLPRLRAARPAGGAFPGAARARGRAGEAGGRALARRRGGHGRRARGARRRCRRRYSTASRPRACSSRPSSTAGSSPSPATSPFPRRPSCAGRRRASLPISLLAETDSPYLAPQPVRGKRNEPAYVVHTLAALAEARGEEPAALEQRIEANACAAFGLPAR